MEGFSWLRFLMGSWARCVFVELPGRALELHAAWLPGRALRLPVAWLIEGAVGKIER